MLDHIRSETKHLTSGCRLFHLRLRLLPITHILSRTLRMLSIFCVLLLASTAAGSLPHHISGKKNYAEPIEYFEPHDLPKIWTGGNFSDCHALLNAGYRRTGVYNLTWNGTPKEAVCYYNGTQAYTVIQQRIYGNVDFNQRLSAYAAGFGNVSGDHWIGLNFIRRLVELGNNQLQITLTSWSRQTVTATYRTFSIGTQDYGWPLTVGNYFGPIPDDLSYSNGRVFYASDVPDPNRCAVNQRGGWWYNYCSYAFLNGFYYRGGRYTPPGSFYDGIYWKDWLGYDYSLMQVVMAVTHG